MTNPPELLTAWTELKEKLLTSFKKRGLTEKGLKLLEMLSENLHSMTFTRVGSPNPPKDIMGNLRDKLPFIKQSCQNLREQYTSGLREDGDTNDTTEYLDMIYMSYIDLVETYHWIAEFNLPLDEKLAKVRRYVNSNQMHKLKDLVDKGEI